jgi:hypothetical protein
VGKLYSRNKRSTDMDNSRSPAAGYILAAVMGAIAGGIAIALITRAIPRMAANMMGNMMARMDSEGCDPEEM